MQVDASSLPELPPQAQSQSQGVVELREEVRNRQPNNIILL